MGKIILLLIAFTLSNSAYAMVDHKDGEGETSTSSQRLVQHTFKETAPLLDLGEALRDSQNLTYRSYTRITNIPDFIEATFLNKSPKKLEVKRAVREEVAALKPKKFVGSKGIIVFDLGSTIIQLVESIKSYRAIYKNIGVMLQRLQGKGYITLACSSRPYKSPSGDDWVKKNLTILDSLGIRFSKEHDVILTAGAHMKSGVIFAPPVTGVGIKKGAVLQEYFTSLFKEKSWLCETSISFIDDQLHNLADARLCLRKLLKDRLSLYQCSAHIFSVRGFRPSELTDGFFYDSATSWDITKAKTIFTEESSLEEAIKPPQEGGYVSYLIKGKLFTALRRP